MGGVDQVCDSLSIVMSIGFSPFYLGQSDYLLAISASSAEGFSIASQQRDSRLPLLFLTFRRLPILVEFLWLFIHFSHSALTRVANNIGDCLFLCNSNNYSWISHALPLHVLLTSHITTTLRNPEEGGKNPQKRWFKRKGMTIQ